MATIKGGSVIFRAGASDDKGTAGCLVSFPELPDKLFMLTAGHVLVGTTAKQFDRVEAEELPGQTLGALFSWTSLGGNVTVDAAIVQVDPALVTAGIGDIAVTGEINTAVQQDTVLTCFSLGKKRSGKVLQTSASRLIDMEGPDFTHPVTYAGQMLCEPFSTEGSSGAIAVDEGGRVVGMVVAGDDTTFTLVTPIDAILRHPDWQGHVLELNVGIPAEAKAPSFPPPVPTSPGIASAGGTPGQTAAQRTLNFFVSRNWTRPQALGLTANIQAESNFNFQAVGDGGQAFGLCQWHPDRQQAFLAQNGHPIQQSTFLEQLGFVDFELRSGTETGAGRQLSQQATAADAATVVSRLYERPKDPDGAVAKHRAQIAMQLDQSLT